MNRNVTNGGLQKATPNQNWTLEQLTQYAKECLTNRSDMTEQLMTLGRRSSVELFRAGHALHFLREKLKADNAYVQWLQDNGIARTTAHEAIRVYQKAQTEVAVEKLTITQAKIKYGVTKKKSSSKPRLPKKKRIEVDGQSDEEGEGPNVVRSAEVIKADIMLVLMAKKLEEVVGWDRNELDPVRLNQLARRCIELLSSFLLKIEGPDGQKGSGSDAA